MTSIGATGRGLMTRTLAAAALLALPGVLPLAPPAAAREAQRPAVHPVSGLQVVPLTVTHGRRVARLRVEVARTPEQQGRGLMFRKTMGANEGMIFPTQVPRVASFWMQNTILPLDLVFIGPDRRIMSVAHGKPYDETPITSGGPVAAVLEINAGRAAALGIGAGDKVSW